MTEPSERGGGGGAQQEPPEQQKSGTPRTTISDPRVLFVASFSTRVSTMRRCQSKAFLAIALTPPPEVSGRSLPARPMVISSASFRKRGGTRAERRQTLGLGLVRPWRFTGKYDRALNNLFSGHGRQGTRVPPLLHHSVYLQAMC